MILRTSQYCKKGDLVGVKGRLQVNNKNDLEVNVDKITFLSNRSQEINESVR